MKLRNLLGYRLLQTTAIRLAIRYVLFYSLILGLVFLSMFWYANRAIDADTAADLERTLLSVVSTCIEGEVSCLKNALERKDGFLFLLAKKDGELLAGNLIEMPELSKRELDGKVHTVLLDEEILPRKIFQNDAYLPVISHTFPSGNLLLLSYVIEDQADDLRELSEYLLEGLALAVLLSFAMGISVGQSVLRRMDSISRIAKNIIAGDLSQRIPVSNRGDEFDSLATQLNHMLDQNQLLIRQMREVTDNVAHDLRSPLTRLLSQLEVVLLGERTINEYREVVQRGAEEVSSLIRTFQALLEIAQVEAGNHRTGWGKVRLDVLMHDLVDLYRPAAEQDEKQLLFELRGIDDCEDAEVLGSRELLSQAFSNLLENALKYTPRSGVISVLVNLVGGHVEIAVSDNGPGIPQEERDHVLQRFVRLDCARNTPGNGLGLSLVKAVASLHGATLTLGDAVPGLIVTLRMIRASI